MAPETKIILWIIGSTVAVIGFVFTMHVAADKEFRAKMEKDIDYLRGRINAIIDRMLK